MHNDNGDDDNNVFNLAIYRAMKKLTPEQRERFKQYIQERQGWTVADIRIEAKAWEFIGQELAKIPDLKKSDKIGDVLPPEVKDRLRLVLEMAQRDEHEMTSH